jgi:fibronectin type 3 domain-containing protein
MGTKRTIPGSEGPGGDALIVKALILDKIWLLVAVLGFLLIGCGKKSPPVSYDAVLPPPILDLETRVREGRLFVRWSMPDVPEKSEKAAVREFKLSRSESSLEDEWCEECPERLEVLDVLRLGRMDNFSRRDDLVIYEDKKVTYGRRYVYRVISISARGHESEPSNRVFVEWDAPPPAPDGVEGSGEDSAAVLHWEPLEVAEGYRIYRKQEGGEFGTEPVGEVGSEEHVYRDTGLVNGVVYRYVVRSLKRVGSTMLESLGSAEVSVRPMDLRAPAAPQGIMAIPVEAGVELSWQRNTEPDVLGYFVYRRIQGKGDYRQLNTAPLQNPMYVDRTVVVGASYQYAVTAVDNSLRRNESVFSESVNVTHVR